MSNDVEVVERPAETSTPAVSTRIAFVSGGMGGIGTAICRRLARQGHTVIAGCLPGYEHKGEWLSSMRGEGLRVHAAEGDVADFDSCAEMFYHARSVVGPVDILVNNAGITRDAIFKRMTEREWLSVINTNLNSVFNVTRQVIDGMIEREWGRIVNISSVNAIKGQFGQTNYSAAKAGMAGFAKALANVTDAQLGDMVPYFGNRQVTRATVAVGVANDWADHYGQLAMYLRLNGILPPTARRGMDD